MIILQIVYVKKKHKILHRYWLLCSKIDNKFECYLPLTTQRVSNCSRDMYPKIVFVGKLWLSINVDTNVSTVDLYLKQKVRYSLKGWEINILSNIVITLYGHTFLRISISSYVRLKTLFITVAINCVALWHVHRSITSNHSQNLSTRRSMDGIPGSSKLIYHIFIYIWYKCCIL